MKTLERALGKGVDFEICSQTWTVKPLAIGDFIELSRHISMTLPDGVDVPDNPLEALDLGDPGQTITVAWLLLRRADPSLSPVRRQNQWFTMTRADAEALIREDFDQSGNTDLIGRLLKASGIFPDSDEVAAADKEPDAKNGEAPGGTVENQPSRSRSKKAQPSSLSGAAGQKSAS